MPNKTQIIPKIDPSWEAVLHNEFQKPYFSKLTAFIAEEKENHIVYPPDELIFNAFGLTPFSKVKVLVLGQDPYHGHGQAHGLGFSVLEGVKFPPSLRNIFKELHSDLGINPPTSGRLDAWAQQGVLLLNTTLTVRQRKAGSHQKKGWEQFTDEVIRTVSQQKERVVFLLWGNYAQSKEPLIDSSKHFIIKSVHPSPLSAYRGFFGSRPFSKINAKLNEWQLPEINWTLPKDEQNLLF